MTRREQIEKYVTDMTAPSYAQVLKQVLEGHMSGGMTTEETVQILLRAVQALYSVDCWLADELDKVESAIPVR
jgi:hypothetical protein